MQIIKTIAVFFLTFLLIPISSIRTMDPFDLVPEESKLVVKDYYDRLVQSGFSETSLNALLLIIHNIPALPSDETNSLRDLLLACQDWHRKTKVKTLCEVNPSFNFSRLIKDFYDTQTKLKNNPHAIHILKALNIIDVKWGAVCSFYKMLDDLYTGHVDTLIRKYPNNKSVKKYKKIHNISKSEVNDRFTEKQKVIILDDLKRDSTSTIYSNVWDEPLVQNFKKQLCNLQSQYLENNKAISNSQLQSDISSFITACFAQKKFNAQNKATLTARSIHDQNVEEIKAREEEAIVHPKKASFTSKTAAYHDETPMQQTKLPYATLQNPGAIVINQTIPTIEYQTEGTYQQVIGSKWNIQDNESFVSIKNQIPICHQISSSKDQLLKGLFQQNIKLTINTIELLVYKIDSFINNDLHMPVDYAQHTFEKLSANYEGHQSFWDYFHHAIPNGVLNGLRKYGHITVSDSNNNNNEPVQVRIPVEIRYHCSYGKNNQVILRELCFAEYFSINSKTTHRCLINMEQYRKKDHEYLLDHVKEFLLTASPELTDRANETAVSQLLSNRLVKMH